VFADERSFVAMVKLHTAMEAAAAASSPARKFLWDYPLPVDFTC
jgi:hypothetical protein